LDNFAATRSLILTPSCEALESVTVVKAFLDACDDVKVKRYGNGLMWMYIHQTGLTLTTMRWQISLTVWSGHDLTTWSTTTWHSPSQFMYN